MKAEDVLELVAKHKGVPVDALRARSEDPVVGRARLLAAHLLYEQFEDMDFVQRKLNCSPAHVRLANSLAQRGDHDGEVFQAELAELRPAAPAQKDAPGPETAQVLTANGSETDPKPVELLFDIIEQRFNLSREDIVRRKSHGDHSSVRLMMALVFKSVFSMKTSEIVSALGSTRYVTTQLITEADRKYGTDKQFTDEVDAVCAKLSVRLDKKTSARV